MITIPIDQQDVLNTTDQLPRLPAAAGLIPVGLKEKKVTNIATRKNTLTAIKYLKLLILLKKLDILIINSMKTSFLIRNDAKHKIQKVMNLYLARIIQKI